MPFYVPKTKHWYSSWWGATVLGALVLVASAILAFGLLIFHYWRAIQSGQGEALRQNFYSQTQISEDPEVTARRKVLETTDDPYLGNASADFVIVEFLDLKCPYCKEQETVMQKIAAKYGYAVKIIVRDFPMESVHEGTTQAAAIASCANEQGGYWLVSNFFFSNQDYLPTELTDEEIGNMCDSYGLDKTLMQECLDAGRGRIEALADKSAMISVVDSGLINGTPIFFVNGELFADENGNKGYVPYETWENIFTNYGLSK